MSWRVLRRRSNQRRRSSTSYISRCHWNVVDYPTSVVVALQCVTGTHRTFKCCQTKESELWLTKLRVNKRVNVLLIQVKTLNFNAATEQCCVTDTTFVNYILTALISASLTQYNGKNNNIWGSLCAHLSISQYFDSLAFQTTKKCNLIYANIVIAQKL